MTLGVADAGSIKHYRIIRNKSRKARYVKRCKSLASLEERACKQFFSTTEKAGSIWPVVHTDSLALSLPGNVGNNEVHLRHDGPLYLPNLERRCSHSACGKILPGRTEGVCGQSISKESILSIERGVRPIYSLTGA